MPITGSGLLLISLPFLISNPSMILVLILQRYKIISYLYSLGYIYTHTRMALLEIGFFLWGGVDFFSDFLRFFGDFSHPSDTGRSPVIRELRFTSVGDFVTPSLVSFGTLQEGLHYAFNFENLNKHFGGTK